MRLAVFACLVGPVFGKFLLDLFLHPCLKLSAVAEEEEDFQPHEERCQEKGLEEIVQKCWGPPFEFSMANKLQCPSHQKDTTGNNGGSIGID